MTINFAKRYAVAFGLCWVGFAIGAFSSVNRTYGDWSVLGFALMFAGFIVWRHTRRVGRVYDNETWREAARRDARRYYSK